MVDGHVHRDVRVARAPIGVDELDLVLELPREMSEPGARADTFRDLKKTVATVAWLAARGLDHPEVVRRVAGSQKHRHQVGLRELDGEAAHFVVKGLRALEIIDPEIRVPESSRSEVNVSRHFDPQYRNDDNRCGDGRGARSP